MKRWTVRFLLFYLIIIIGCGTYLLWRRDMYKNPRPEDVPALLRALKDEPPPSVFRKAADLFRMRRILNAYYGKGYITHQAAEKALVHLGKLAVPQLIECLG